MTLAHKERRVLLELKEHRDHKEALVTLAHKERRAQQELREHKEVKVVRDQLLRLQGQLDPLELKEHKEVREV